MMPEPPPRTDPRIDGPVVRRPAGPPPISGGTLLVLHDGRAALSDPDRDRVLVVEVDPARIAAEIALRPGDEPGRLAEDAAGRLHVALRGSGEILTVDLPHAAHPSRRTVCPMPRGLAYDPSSDQIHVACRGGELVSLPAAGGPARRTLHLDRDLRDVVVSGDRLLVTRFRQAEVLTVGADGSIAGRARPADQDQTEAKVAWRAVATPDGRLVVVHQRHSLGEVRPAFGGYGSPFSFCDGIVRTELSVFAGGALEPGPQVASAVLPVDLALDVDAGRAVRATVVSAADQGSAPSLRTIPAEQLAGRACMFESPTDTPIPGPVAVAYTADHRLLVQARDPAQLWVVQPGGGEARAIPLGGQAAYDTGHAIFHGATGAGIACASCHPEGGDDGHVWRFEGVGARRTPALHAAAGSAPFHWSGDLADIQALVNEVLVLRMRGPALDAAHADALEAWLAHVPAPRQAASPSPQLARGRAVFEARGCADCHSGRTGSSGRSADVGTGGAFQTPALAGLADRLPLMHTGCARTVADRFDPACGGATHGDPVPAAELPDLVAYLESL